MTVRISRTGKENNTRNHNCFASLSTAIPTIHRGLTAGHDSHFANHRTDTGHFSLASSKVARDWLACLNSPDCSGDSGEFCGGICRGQRSQPINYHFAFCHCCGALVWSRGNVRLDANHFLSCACSRYRCLDRLGDRIVYSLHGTRSQGVS